MAESAQKQSCFDENNIEYSVYIHHGNDNIEKSGRWERASKTLDRVLALEQAQMLHDSNKYHKIEVKKTFFCKNRKKRIGQTCKIYDKTSDIKEKKAPIWLALTMILGMCFSVAFFIGNE